MMSRDMNEEERAEFCARVWQGIAVRLDAAAPGTRIRFAPRGGLIWASPPSGTDPYRLSGWKEAPMAEREKDWADEKARRLSGLLRAMRRNAVLPEDSEANELAALVMAIREAHDAGRKEEREACAKACDDEAAENRAGVSYPAKLCAARIRSRGAAPEKPAPACPDCGEAKATVRHDACGDTRSDPDAIDLSSGAGPEEMARRYERAKRATSLWTTPIDATAPIPEAEIDESVTAAGVAEAVKGATWPRKLDAAVVNSLKTTTLRGASYAGVPAHEALELFGEAFAALDAMTEAKDG